MLAEVTLVLLLVSLTCGTLLAGYQGGVRIMQSHNRQQAAQELAEAVDEAAADNAAARLGLQIERKAVAAGNKIIQRIVTVSEIKTKKIIVNKVRYELSQ